MKTRGILLMVIGGLLMCTAVSITHWILSLMVASLAVSVFVIGVGSLVVEQ
jgi:multisubunit Na+/H+ antiporter MnhC subunit